MSHPDAEPDLEQRVSKLQSELERLNSSLVQWRDQQRNVEPIERRVTELMQQCADILDKWTLTDLRHTQAVGEMEARLNHWSEIEHRFQEDARQRVRELERRIEQEWEGLREMFAEPVKDLQEHALSLRETSVAAASSALSGLERAEHRLASIEADLLRQMSQLSREVHQAIAELRNDVRRPAPPGVPSWPLDSVRRLHDEMRDAGGDTAGPSPTVIDHEAPEPKRISLLPTQAAVNLGERLDRVEEAVSHVREDAHEAAERVKGSSRLSRGALLLLAAALIGVLAFAFMVQRRADATAAQAAAAVAAAERKVQSVQGEAEKERKSADDQIALARLAAARAQIVSDVLAAPDLIRYSLVGGEASPRATAQALWSRSRGLVFTASRVPQAPDGSSYQLWLLTPGAPVSAGTMTPDSAGRISMATDQPPDIPRQVVGFILSTEPTSGSTTPTGARVLGPRPILPPQ